MNATDLPSRHPAFTNPTIRIAQSAYLCDTAVLEGDIEVGEEVSIWHYAVLRADFGPIRIGAFSNIQEHVAVHMSRGSSVEIGSLVTVGHGAILHGCKVEDRCIIGMGAVLRNGAHIGTGSIVAEGSVVPAGVYPPNSILYGKTVKRAATQRDMERIFANACDYQSLIPRRPGTPSAAPAPAVLSDSAGRNGVAAYPQLPTLVLSPA